MWILCLQVVYAATKWPALHEGFFNCYNVYTQISTGKHTQKNGDWLFCHCQLMSLPFCCFSDFKLDFMNARKTGSSRKRHGGQWIRNSDYFNASLSCKMYRQLNNVRAQRDAEWSCANVLYFYVCHSIVLEKSKKLCFITADHSWRWWHSMTTEC